jgi:hypothetical protein
MENTGFTVGPLNHPLPNIIILNIGAPFARAVLPRVSLPICHRPKNAIHELPLSSRPTPPLLRLAQASKAHLPPPAHPRYTITVPLPTGVVLTSFRHHWCLLHNVHKLPPCIIHNHHPHNALSTFRSIQKINPPA